MNYLTASNYIFEHAEELVQQKKVLVGLHYTNTNKKHSIGSFIVMKPFKKNDNFGYYLYVAVTRKMNQPLHLRNARNFTVKQDRHEKFAALQPNDIAQLNYQIMPLSQVDGVIAQDLANNMLKRLNITVPGATTSENTEEHAAATEQPVEA